MLSCLVPPRFGQEDKIASMPSSPAFSMQFPSLASSLHHHSQNKSDDSSSGSTTATVAQASGHGGLVDYIVKCPQCHQRLPGFQALHEHIETEHGLDKMHFGNPHHPNGYHHIDREMDFSCRQSMLNKHIHNNTTNHASNPNNNNKNNKNYNNIKLQSIINNCHSSSPSSPSMSSSMIQNSVGGVGGNVIGSNCGGIGGSGGTSSPLSSSHSPLAGVSAQRNTPPTDLSSQYHHHAMAMAALAVGMSTSATVASNGYDASAAAIAAAEAMAIAGSRSTTSPLNGHTISGNGNCNSNIGGCSGPDMGGGGGSGVGSGGNSGVSVAPGLGASSGNNASIVGGSGNGNCGASTTSSSSSSTSSSLSMGLSTSCNGPYQCSQCSAAFPNRDLLEKHELMHSPNAAGINQSCKICHKAFANVYRLQRHMISHDESALLRKFKCTQCDKAFKFKHHLKEHVRIHSGEKPFGCDNCGKRFSHSGSFSSHMTSKKCISMGLKLNNNRAMLKSLEKNGVLTNSQNCKRVGLPHSPAGGNPLNYFPHNLTGGSANGGPSDISSGNGSSPFYQMLPKYSEYNAMNAALLATFQNPFYNMAALSPNIHPYNIHRILELTAGNQRLQSDPEDLIEEVTEDVADEPKLVMDLDENEKDTEMDEENVRTYNQSEDEGDDDSRNSNDSTIPKQNLEEVSEDKLKKERLDSPTPETQQRQQSPEIKVEEEEEEQIQSLENELEEEIKPAAELRCRRCEKLFNHPTELVQHEKVLCCLIKQEIEQQQQKHLQNHLRTNELEVTNASYPQSGSDEDLEDRESKNGSEGGERKVRVRTAITEEQQTVLKQHYAINARPSRDEFRMIASRLSLDARVVQVWFQNNRSRERKLHNTFNGLSKTYQNLIPDSIQTESPPSSIKSMKISTGDDQPLDLSLKKESLANQQLAHSPLYGSVPMQVDTNEAINLSRKLSPSLTPYKQPLYYGSSVPNQRQTDIPMPHHIRQTPSPNEAMPPLPRYPTTGNPYMIPGTTVGRAMVPMECLFQMTPEYARNHLMGNIKIRGGGSDRGTSLSPVSEKRSWRDDESRISHDDEYMSAAAAAVAASRLMPIPPKRVKMETHGHAGDPDLPFVCDQCDKAFAKQSSLARHKYEHSGQRPYKCVDCPKAFKHKHHLTEHKRLHTGEKPFECKKCLKRFSHSGSFSQHMNHRYSYCKPYRE